MDGKRFDTLVRTLESRFSRRSTLGALTALAAGGVLVEQADARKKCKGNKKRCGDRCIPKKNCCKDSNCPSGKSCIGGRCIDSGGGSCPGGCPANQVCDGGVCVAAGDVCPTAFVCNGFGGDAPVCGSEAGGGDCGCYQSTEGNSVCLNQTGIDGGSLQECDTTEDCEGFHFFCRKPLSNQSGQFCGQSVGRCWPECDNTD